MGDPRMDHLASLLRRLRPRVASLSATLLAAGAASCGSPAPPPLTPSRPAIAPCSLPADAVLQPGGKGDYEVAEDSELGRCDVPASTFTVTVLDVNDAPVPNVPLVVSRYTEPRGELTELARGTSDARGQANFPVPPGDHYTVAARYQGGRFAAQLIVPAGHGVAVRLHVSPTTTDAKATKAAFQALVLVERSGDRVHVAQVFRAVNFGTNALLFDEVLRLPPSLEGFEVEGTPEQLHVERTADGHARLVDTIAPRLHEASFSYDVKKRSGGEQVLELSMPSRTALARVVYVTEQPGALVVDGAPPAALKEGQGGTKALVTEASFVNDGARRSLRITLKK
jgi:hypothetical protein